MEVNFSQAQFVFMIDHFFASKFFIKVVEIISTTPNLPPPDFFLYGYPKARIHGKSPHSVDDLKANVEHEIQQIIFRTLSLKCGKIHSFIHVSEEVGHILNISYDSVTFSFSFVSQHNHSFSLAHLCTLNHVCMYACF